VRTRRAAGGFAGALAALLLPGCLADSGATAPPEPGPRGPAAAALVYEHEIDGNKDLYVLATDAAEPRRLTSEPSDDGLPRWTPDGRAVVYTTDLAGNWQLYRVSAEGGAPTRVRSNPYTEWQADVSPDGRTLAFLSNMEGPELLWLMDLATRSCRALVRHGKRTIMGNPHWSPDGKRIVFSSNWKIGHHIYVVEVESGETERISPLATGGCEPHFSPDGKKVVYVSRRHQASTSRLVEHDLASHEERVLVGWPALNYDPVYSPDGTELAFASDITGEWAIYRQRISDGRAFRMTHRKGPARYPDYRPLPR
jgi:TolB protein